MQQSRAEIDDLQSFFMLEVQQCSALSYPGKVLNLAGWAGWRQRAPLRYSGRQYLLGSVCIRKAFGNAVRTKEFLMDMSHFRHSNIETFWQKYLGLYSITQTGLWRYLLYMELSPAIMAMLLHFNLGI